MPPFLKAGCGGLEDFGFEVSESGNISFDTTIAMDENEWKDDVDEFDGLPWWTWKKKEHSHSISDKII